MNKKKTILFQIKAPHLCAGGQIENRTVVIAAPIIGYMIGWNAEKVLAYCKKMKWEIKSYREQGK